MSELMVWSSAKSRYNYAILLPAFLLLPWLLWEKGAELLSLPEKRCCLMGLVETIARETSTLSGIHWCEARMQPPFLPSVPC